MKRPFSLFMVAITMIVLVAALGIGCQQNQTAASAAQPSPAATPDGTATPLSPNTPTQTPPASSSPRIAASPMPLVSPTITSSNDVATAGVKAVIQKANDEQQQAFSKNDPTIMKDTSTTTYYNQMVQTNKDLASNGVSAIKLIRIEWGAITFPVATTAKATTYETWQTTLADGSTFQSRDRNDYTLVLDQGAWKIQADDIPNSGPSIPPNL